MKSQSLTSPPISLLPLWGIGFGLLLWWLFTSPLWHSNPILNDFSPERSFVALLNLFVRGEIMPHILTSCRRVLVGLVLASAIGVPLGVLIGLYRSLESALSAVFQFLRMISPLSWMPLAVMVLGIGDLPVYFLLTVAAIWPILLNTAAGVNAVDRSWLTLARSLCATRGETVFQVILPAIIENFGSETPSFYDGFTVKY